MTRIEWLSRAAQRYIEVLGATSDEAQQFASKLFDAQGEEFDALAPCNPEVCADEDIAHNVTLGVRLQNSARELATELFYSSQPNSESMSTWSCAVDQWCANGFDKLSGPVFDEVNALRKLWWHDGSDERREACYTAIVALGEVLNLEMEAENVA